jgi:hypothetical protein
MDGWLVGWLLACLAGWLAGYNAVSCDHVAWNDME